MFEPGFSLTFVIHVFRSLFGVGYRANESIARTSNHDNTRNSEDQPGSTSFDGHGRYWMNAAGRVLALLLHHAGYGLEEQDFHLTYFQRNITPLLGNNPSESEIKSPWHSFMTDDGTPIELSWDWGSAESSPTIRYSVEFVGRHAGSASDPSNRYAAVMFHNEVVKNMPGANFAWFEHFHGLFCNESLYSSVDNDDNKTRIFYAFDLKKGHAVAKTYFFPGHRAKSQRQPVWDIIENAIRTAPECTDTNLEALSTLRNFFAADWGTPLELEMLAIDLVDPLEARLKIYFRSRDTGTDNMARILSVNELDESGSSKKGITNVISLWNSLFVRDECDTLPEKQHRTAGVLYYATFRLGDKLPKMKLYIPVRHYAASDYQIWGTLKTHLAQHHHDGSVTRYDEFLKQAFSSKDLDVDCGVHTYVGCSIRADGSLGLISYINPQRHKILQGGSSSPS